MVVFLIAPVLQTSQQEEVCNEHVTIQRENSFDGNDQKNNKYIVVNKSLEIAIKNLMK